MGQYYEYNGSVISSSRCRCRCPEKEKEKGMTIGGYESAFFVNLVAARLLKNIEELMTDTMFNGLYKAQQHLIDSRSLP